jgi:hypothetical protein
VRLPRKGRGGGICCDGPMQVKLTEALQEYGVKPAGFLGIGKPLTLLKAFKPDAEMKKRLYELTVNGITIVVIGCKVFDESDRR